MAAIPTVSFRTLGAAFALSLAALPAVAQQTSPPPRLDLQLNGAQSSDKGCRLTFVVTNNLGAELAKAAFEIALFSGDGVVERLTVLDFGTLAAGKTKVARFDLVGVDCGTIGRVLVNDATECAGTGVAPDACMRSLATESKTTIAFGV